MKKNLQILLAVLAMTLMACNGQNESAGESAANEDVATSVEDAVTSISAALDDQSGVTYATQMKKSYPQLIEELLVPKAYAANCIRPVNLSCDNGIKYSTFSDCSMFRGFVVASGEINLDYSQNDCSMASNGDSVVRTYDYELVGPRNGQLNVSSEEHTDYRGNTIGGGAQLTRVDAGWELDVFGKHKVFTRNGRTRMDKSIRTLSALEISGGIARGQRQVNNGQIEIIHNLAEFTATYTANDLEYSSSCCHPVSGSLSVDFTGSIEGSGTVTFNSCGSAQIERNGEIQDVTFTYCE